MKANLFFCIPIVFMAQFAQAQTYLSAKGTGRTTGHIATIFFQNNAENTVEVLPQTVYIPSVGQFQSYVGRIPGWPEVLAGATIALPVDGYCTDVQAPPVPSGVDMHITDWIPVGEVAGTSANPKFPGDKPKVVMATHAPAPPFSRNLIGNIISSNVFTPVKPNDAPAIKPVWPGTNIPVDGTIDPNKNPTKVAPMLVKAVQEIENAVANIQQDPNFTTPFSPDPDKEKEAIIQQTIWVYVGALTGEPYEEEDFKENVYQQYQNTTGTSPKSLPKSEKEKVDDGVADFWNVFMATGVEAKVLKKPVGTTFNNNIPGENKPKTPVEQIKSTCTLTEEINDSGEDLDYAIADTGTKEKNEEVKEAFKAAIEKVAGMVSEVNGSDTVDVEFTTPEMPASAWSYYVSHIVASRANATAFGVDLQNPQHSAWTTEPIETKADGTHTVTLTHEIGDDCKSTLIGINVAKVRAAAGMDQTLGSVDALKIVNFVGEIAIDIAIKKGKGTFKKLGKYLKEKTKDMAKDKAKELIKEELKKLGKELEGKSEEEAEQTLEEFLESIKTGDEEEEPDDTLEDWLAEILVEGDDFDPADKVESEILDKVDSPIDWSPIKTNTYALAEGALQIWVDDIKGKASAASGVRYKREEFESNDEAVKGGGVFCQQATVSHTASGTITLKTEGNSASYAGATGEGIIDTGHGSATATLESFNGLYVIAICECPSGIFYDKYVDVTVSSQEAMMSRVWVHVFENLLGDVMKATTDKINALPSHQTKLPKGFKEKVQKDMEQAAARAMKTVLPCN
jgi:hypothetical protein